MKRMHASVQETVALDGNRAIFVNSEHGKILTACFNAAKNNKPLPYKIYAYCNDEKFHEFILATDEQGKYQLVSYGYEGSKVTPLYHINESTVTIEAGVVYYVNEF